jgi:CubicO group peptidase (beta-lactamase class C family)
MSSLGVASVPEIFGDCDQRFADVRDALAGNFADHDELGAAVAVVVDGEVVVDIWAGWMDGARTRRWRRDTLVDVFSVGKAMAALCVLILVEREQVDLDAPVSRYWPEFARRGKADVTARMLLSHRAGLPAIRDPLPELAMYDWELMAASLAWEEPWWEPDSRHGYHVNTFGFLTGEVVRRVSGRSIGAFFRDEVAARLDADFHFGIGLDDDARTAEYLFGSHSSEFVKGDEREQLVENDKERHLMLARAYFNPGGISGVSTVNTRAWRAAQIPSANAHATARAVARIYSALASGGAVDGIRIMHPETVAHAIAEASLGTDFVLGRPSRFGLGFQLTQPERPFGPNPRSFGHFGAGGSVGFADPDAGLAFGYTMNNSGPRWQNPRNRALIDAVYASL